MVQMQQSPLNTLQSMVNVVLIETGKALRSANVKGVKTIGHTHDRLQGLLPNAIDKFHLALDDLESDIVRAKAVLDRDLRELRARRRASDDPVVEGDSISLPAKSVDLPCTPSSHALMDLKLDPIPELESKRAATADTSPPKLKVENNSVPPLPDQGLQDQVQVHPQEPLETPIQQAKADGFPMLDDVQQNSTNKDTTNGLSLDLSITVPSSASEALMTSGLQSSTFSSIFDTNNHGDSDLTFDFDFTTDGTGNQNLDFGGSNGDLDLSSFRGQVTSNQSNIDSMLQDLDGYGNASSSDFNMVNLSNSTNQTGDQGGSTVAEDFGMSGSDLDMTMGMGANESNFDEMVSGMDFGDGDVGGQFNDAFFSFTDA